MRRRPIEINKIDAIRPGETFDLRFPRSECFQFNLIIGQNTDMQLQRYLENHHIKKSMSRCFSLVYGGYNKLNMP